MDPDSTGDVRTIAILNVLASPPGRATSVVQRRAATCCLRGVAPCPGAGESPPRGEPQSCRQPRKGHQTVLELVN